MEGNKDEAARCIEIAEAAIATGNKQRALKFIKIAQRLNKDLSVDALLAACERLDSAGSTSSEERKPVEQRSREAQPSNSSSSTNGERAYTEEHVKLVREIKRNKDYYAVLGVEKTCTVEEIRKAYRKLSLKVHPDKNQAPGSDEAFKIVSKAFKCLSDDDSRRQYDQIGHVDEFEYNQQHDVRRRRRRNPQDMFHDDFDPDEIFRSFFGQTEMFRAAHVYRSRHMGGQQRQQHVHEGGFNYMVLIQILPFLVIFLLAYLPFSEPDYSLQKTFSYQYPQMTEKYGVEYFVKSDFDHHYPPGSPSRASLEDQVVTEYKNVLGRYCHVELQRRQWNRNYPKPHCDKLRDLGVVH